MEDRESREVLGCVLGAAEDMQGRDRLVSAT